MAKFSNKYIFGFAALICVVCGTALAGISGALKEQQEINRVRDVRGNILVALGLPEDGSALEGERIDALWAERVEERFLDAGGQPADASLDQDGDGDVDGDDASLARDAAQGGSDAPKVLSVYVRKDDAAIGAVAIPMEGNGLWGPISGYLAVGPNGAEVVGATFFAPKETPGLGAEIVEPKFKQQWLGKSVSDNGKPTPVRVVKGSASTLCPGEEHRCVDGISGATITSRGVDVMVEQAMNWYGPYLKGLSGSRR